MKNLAPSSHRYVCGNSFDSIALPDQSIDLVVSSPPYPMIEMWDESFCSDDSSIRMCLDNGNGKDAFEKMHLLLDRCWSELFRVVVDGGFVCINVGDAARSLNGRFQLFSNHSRVVHKMISLGFDMLPSIICRKPSNVPTRFMGSGMLPAGAYVTLEHEHILIFRKGEKRSFSKEENKLRSASAMFWEERNQWFSDQWEIFGTRQLLAMKSERNRAAAFPVEIALRLINMYSMYGDTILDPFNGTGTTSLAAMVSGRNSIGIDADKTRVLSSAAIPTKRKMKELLNDLLISRIKEHLVYVNSKNELFFKYRNEHLGIPVKTRQEIGLNIYPIKSIRRREDDLCCKYAKFKKEEILALYRSI